MTGRKYLAEQIDKLLVDKGVSEENLAQSIADIIMEEILTEHSCCDVQTWAFKDEQVYFAFEHEKTQEQKETNKRIKEARRAIEKQEEEDFWRRQQEKEENND